MSDKFDKILHDEVIEELKNSFPILDINIDKVKSSIDEIITDELDYKSKVENILNNMDILGSLDNETFDLIASYYLYILNEEKENIDEINKNNLEEEIIAILNNGSIEEIKNYTNGITDIDKFKVLIEKAFLKGNKGANNSYLLHIRGFFSEVDIEIGKYLFLENYDDIVDKKKNLRETNLFILGINTGSGKNQALLNVFIDLDMKLPTFLKYKKLLLKTKTSDFLTSFVNKDVTNHLDRSKYSNYLKHYIMYKENGGDKDFEYILSNKPDHFLKIKF